jgi:hypothetical protein
MDWAQILREFGNPVTALLAVIFGSATGWIIWKGSHDKIVAVLESRCTDITAQRDTAMTGWKLQTDANVEMAIGLKTQNDLVMRLVNERKRGS